MLHVYMFTCTENSTRLEIIEYGVKRLKKIIIAGCLIFVLQSLMLQIAQGWIENEKKELVVAKQAYMAETCPPPNLSGDQATLMVRLMAALFWSYI